MADVPNKIACQVVAATARAEAIIQKTIRDAKNLREKAAKVKAALLWGTITDLADAIGAELLSNIEIVSGMIADAVLASVSKFASSIIEALLREVLKILLAFPEAVFSLVSIPKDAAVQSATNETSYLLKVTDRMNIIISIITKYALNAIDSHNYYDQIRRAIPHIQNSLIFIKDVIYKLDIAQQESEINGAFFDEKQYNRMRTELRTAIDILKPKSFLDSQLGISKNLEKTKQKYVTKLTMQINTEFNKISSEIDSKYMVANIEREKNLDNQMLSINQSQDQSDTKKLLTEKAIRFKYAIEQNKADVEWAADIRNNNNNRASALSSVDAKAMYMAIKESSAWEFSTIHFQDDMILLTDALNNILDDVKMAYENNKMCQIYCNTCYNSKSLIQTLVREIINILRIFGNSSASLLVNGLQFSQSLITGSLNGLQKAKTRKEDPSDKISACELSLAASINRTKLVLADSSNSTIVTESLIKVINSSAFMTSENHEFENFILHLSQIPDWDGKRNVWAVNPLESSINPYIALIADLFDLLVSVPALSFSGNQDDVKKSINMINTVKQRLQSINSHLNYVMQVLKSWEPFKSDEIFNIKKVLDMAGLTNAFAQSLALTSIMAEIGMEINDSLNSPPANLDSCSANNAYPELFSDIPDFNEYKANKERDKINSGALAVASPSSQNINEKNYGPTMALRMELKNYDICTQVGDYPITEFKDGPG